MESGALRQKIMESKPRLRTIASAHGTFSLLSYAARLRAAKVDVPSARRNELLTVVSDELSRLFGGTIARRATEQFAEQWYASTAEHHAPVCHPFVVSGTVVAALEQAAQGKPSVLVFSCGTISLNNSSFPRGLMYHTADGREDRLYLLPWKERRVSVGQARPYTIADFQRFARAAGGLFDQLLAIYGASDVLAQQSFADQISITNHRLWQKIPGPLTDLLYIQFERIVAALIVRFHLATTSTAIAQLLFNSAWQASFERLFDGLPGAFSHATRKGTFLFWGMRHGIRVQLQRAGNDLVSLDGLLRIALTPETIAAALERGELVPSMALCFIVLAFYYGVTCGGGFSQVDYLPRMGEAYQRLLAEQGRGDEFVQPAAVDYLSSDYAFVSLRQEEGQQLATGLDLLLYAHEKTAMQLRELAATYPLASALDNLMPEFYTIVKDRVPPKTAAIGAFQPKHVMPRCLSCGNNPVHHTLVWFNSTTTILMTPFNHFLATSRIGRFFNWLTEALLFGMLHFFRLIGMVRFYGKKEDCTITRARALWDDAQLLGITMEGATFLGKQIDFYRATVNGKVLYFNGLRRPVQTDSTAQLWMDDKAILKEKLLAAGLPVAAGGSYTEFGALQAAFQNLQKPVIIKPRLGSRGRHTTTYIYTEEQLRQAFDSAKQLCHWVVMEEHIVGHVYRGTMIGGKLRGVLGGAPPHVVGDGVHTITELVGLKNASDHPGVKDMVIMPMTIDFLNRSGHALETVLAVGQMTDLAHTIGVSYGGASFEVTPETHPDIRVILERAAAVVNDPLIGFDFIIPDPTRSPAEQRWGIIECNGIPFINLHHYPLQGKPNNVGQYVWQLML